MNLRCREVCSHGSADRARLQEARARWLGEHAVRESKLARVGRLGKTQHGCKRHERGASENLRCRKVNTHGLAVRTRQVCKRHERGSSMNLRCRRVNSHGLADPARLQEARGRWLGELAAQEIKLARVSRSGKVARSTGEVARRTYEGGK
ncbi:hypothetical protein CDL15_Pgr007993 [Punica granatum]|uniref:Uncharacterized protein n=1 Tax=Punica granatum TaxID=22663 RepID=A0A218WCY9_PUNGR|nr:hypothetical protein CDL15_Pgr007993 [Punica granatum]